MEIIKTLHVKFFHSGSPAPCMVTVKVCARSIVRSNSRDQRLKNKFSNIKINIRKFIFIFVLAVKANPEFVNVI